MLFLRINFFTNKFTNFLPSKFIISLFISKSYYSCYKTYIVIMEKQKQRHKSYKDKGISGNELALLNLASENNLVVFSVEELHRLSAWRKNKIYNTLFSLKQKEILVKIQRDKYTLKKDISEKLFEISTSTVIPSYISFWTALSFYGFTEQQIKTIQLVTTKQHPELKFNSRVIEVTAFGTKKFYGYLRESNFVIAEKEKSLVDSLYQPEKCGGFTEFANCLRNACGNISMKKFINYLIIFGNKSMISRAGYLLEEFGTNSEILQKYKSKTYIKLNPEKENFGEYNKRWNIIINEKIKIKEIK